MPLKKKDDYVPIKCEGWDGKFLFAEGTTNNVSKVHRYNQNITDTSNFYGYNTEPIVLPVTWDGTFVKSNETYIKPDRNRSDDSEYFGNITEPTILPATLNEKIEMDSNDACNKLERNFSDMRNYAETNRFKRLN